MTETHTILVKEDVKENTDRASIINEFGTQILASKYYAEGETSPEQVFWRVAKVVSIPDVIEKIHNKNISPEEHFDYANYFKPYEELVKTVAFRRFNSNGRLTDKKVDEVVKLWEKETWKYYEMIKNLDFMPASPMLLNAGLNGMLSSCFFMRPKDSLENIFQTLKDVAIVMKKGGGVGLDFSKIRPKDSKVGTRDGVATGPVSYMKIFDEMGDHISQGSVRKAAMLASLRVDHPDIMEFIHCKNREGELHNFNISVLITDKFMEAVEGDLEIELYHPIMGTEKLKKTIRAREIWDAISDSAHSNGEPGVIFQDEVDRFDVFKGKYGKLGVNPCQPSDAPLLDGDKLTKISEGGKTWSSWKTGVKNLVELKCNNGLKIRCTSDHKMVLDDDSELRAKDCLHKNIKWGLGNRKAEKFLDKEILRGFLFGDGYLTGHKKGISVKLDKEKQSEVVDLLLKSGFHEQERGGEYYINKKELEFKLGDLSFLEFRTFNRLLPDEVFFGNSDKVVSFLRGLFSANGSCSKMLGCVSLKSTCLPMLEKVQVLLASFGIPSWMIENKPNKTKWHNGTYTSRMSWNLQIATSNAHKFGTKIGFLHKYKMKNIRKSNHKYSTKLKVVSITNGSKEEVWDYRMNKPPHYNFCQGAILKNCSELNLSEYSSCALAAINLKNFFDNESKSIAWMNLKKTVELGVRFVDNTLDLNSYPLSAIEESSLRDRKIGLGVMGLHDLLLLCGLPYRYDDANTKPLIDELFGSIKKWAIEESERLGQTRGVPASLVEMGINRRNSGVLTCQPAGSISLIANQTSNGIEPVFRWSYIRKDSHGTHEMKHFLLDIFSKDELPDYAKTALEILPDDHVIMQAAIQKYICSSISKTVNMENNTTVADVERVFKLAYDLKCKSIAIYRTGSRQEEVLSKKRAIDSKKKGEPQKSPIRARPRFLPGVTFRINTPGGKAYVTINEDEEGIREVFAHISKAGSEIGSHVEAEGRLISYALKHRNPVAGLVNHLSGQKSNPIWEHGRSIKSVPDAMAKCMQEYIDHWEGFSFYLEDYIGEDSKKEKHDDNSEFSGDLCTNCGEPLYMEGKCEVCKSCGFSTCG